MSSFSGTGPVYEYYHFKVLITLEQVNTSVVEKKKKNLDGEANRSGVVNFHSMQMSVVMSMHAYCR